MAMTDCNAAEEYVAAQLPYKMPACKLEGAPVLYFAAWKKHLWLYAATGVVVAAFENELAAYEVNKGTIRFPLSEPVPVKLIARIAGFRAKEVAGREKAKDRGRSHGRPLA